MAKFIAAFVVAAYAALVWATHGSPQALGILAWGFIAAGGVWFAEDLSGLIDPLKLSRVTSDSPLAVVQMLSLFLLIYPGGMLVISQ